MPWSLLQFGPEPPVMPDMVTLSFAFFTSDTLCWKLAIYLLYVTSTSKALDSSQHARLLNQVFLKVQVYDISSNDSCSKDITMGYVPNTLGNTTDRRLGQQGIYSHPLLYSILYYCIPSAGKEWPRYGHYCCVFMWLLIKYTVCKP